MNGDVLSSYWSLGRRGELCRALEPSPRQYSITVPAITDLSLHRTDLRAAERPLLCYYYCNSKTEVIFQLLLSLSAAAQRSVLCSERSVIIGTVLHSV